MGQAHHLEKWFLNQFVPMVAQSHLVAVLFLQQPGL
jgi:hypothetical protein